jgi:hypothetical protein
MNHKKLSELAGEEFTKFMYATWSSTATPAIYVTRSGNDFMVGDGKESSTPTVPLESLADAIRAMRKGN